MSRAMGDALIDSIAKGQTVNRDVRMIATWIADVRFRLCFPEAPELQGLRGQTHLHARCTERAAHDASFSNVSIDPSFIDENGMHGANGYVRTREYLPPWRSRSWLHTPSMPRPTSRRSTRLTDQECIAAFITAESTLR